MQVVAVGIVLEVAERLQRDEAGSLVAVCQAEWVFVLWLAALPCCEDLRADLL